MSFRKFGGLQFASKHNTVSSNYNTSNLLVVTQNVGQPNSYINFESDISGNINGNLLTGNGNGNLLNGNGNGLIASNPGDYDLTGNLQVSGDIDINGNMNINGNNITKVSNITNPLGNITITPLNNLIVAKNLDMSSNNITKVSNITNTLGNITITPLNNLIVAKNLDMSGNNITKVSNITNTLGNIIITPVTSGMVIVGGNIATTGSITASLLTLTSDYRIKKNIEEISIPELKNIDSLKPVKYFNTVNKKPEYGFIAHELQEYFPELVTGYKDS
jgi:hypothetical protein